MRILHCCLSNFYIDNYGYQENILPLMHKYQNHEVAILASTETYLKNRKIGYIKPSTYFTNEGIPITRVPYVKWLPVKVACKLRVYNGIEKMLDDFNPEFIFLHNFQFLSVLDIVSYVIKHPGVKVVADSHTDYINSARDFVSRRILHGIIYKYCAKKSDKIVSKYYGTLPIRSDFLSRVYGVPENKISFLPMGVNDLSIDYLKRDDIRRCVRRDLGVENNDFVIITGGKLNKLKNIDVLINSFRKIENKKIKLLIFGKPEPNFEKEFSNLISQNNKILYLGWLSATDTYKYFFASDLACFPGTHSTLWEEAVGLGIPAIFKYWEGITHIDRGGNSLLLDNPTEDSLYNWLLNVCDNIDDLYANMKKRATSKDVMNYFSYSDIAKRSIDI